MNIVIPAVNSRSFWIRKRLTELTTLVLLLLLTACGKEASEEVVTLQPQTVSVNIDPTLGGSLTDSNNNDLLQFTEDSLSEVANVTLKISPPDGQFEAERIQSLVYEFSGEIKEFKQAALLRLPLINSGVAEGYVPRVAELRNGHWFAIPGTEYKADGFVQARIHKLGTYAVVFEPFTKVSRTLGPTCDNEATQQTISFVHLADLHSRYGIKNKNAYARMKAYHKAVLNENPYTFFTNGGDDFEKGHIAETLSSGLTTVAITQAMQFDARIIGNHDFAWGSELLFDFAHDPHGVVLSSNIIYKGDNYRDFPGVEFVKFQVGCVTVGMFGLVGLPWNEFDQEYFGDYLSAATVDSWWNQVAENLVGEYRDQVDLMVLLSHLGWGTDNALAEQIPGIDIVLGGHSHGGVQYREDVNGAVILQPEFYGDGITRLDVIFDIKNKLVTSIEPVHTPTEQLSEIDPVIQAFIEQQINQAAPEADQELTQVANARKGESLTEIIASAANFLHPSDAILLNPEYAQRSEINSGGLSQQDLYLITLSERQKPDTPAVNSLYQVTVTGEQLNLMRQRQPQWYAVMPGSIEPNSQHKVILHKAPALHPEYFFGEGIQYETTSFASESWLALDKYARSRNNQCLYLDVEQPLLSCDPTIATSTWSFNNEAQPLAADTGPAMLQFYDPQQSNWHQQQVTFVSTDEARLPALAGSHSSKRVMAFPLHGPEQGLQIRHFATANGDFSGQNLVADYTLIMDVLFPQSSDGQWRSLLQTDYSNQSDGDWFINNSSMGGIGISGYFGSIIPGQWHRIAMVVYAAPENGSAKFYIDGVEVGTIGDINERWALTENFLLLADDNGQTQAGYLANILFSGRPFTENEIAQLGGASASIQQP